MNIKNNPNMILYVGSTCRYCQKVIHFLNEHKIAMDIIDVWDDAEALEELRKLTGKTQVPCLKVDENFILESDDIIAALKK